MSGAVEYLFNHALHQADESGVTVGPPNPEDIPILDKLQVAAQAAAAQVDADCTGFCRLPWIRGTKIHTAFAGMVRGMGADFSAEVSYRDQVVVRYGSLGSVRADAVYGNIASPKFVVDLKTGWNYMSTGEAKRYYRNVPKGTDIYSLKVN